MRPRAVWPPIWMLTGVEFVLSGIIFVSFLFLLFFFSFCLLELHPLCQSRAHIPFLRDCTGVGWQSLESRHAWTEPY